MNFLLSDPQESEPPWELPSQCGKFWDLNVKRILFMGNPLLSSGKGRELHPVIDRPTIKKAILDKVIVSRLYFRRVGRSLVFAGCLSPKAHHSMDIRAWIRLRFHSLKRARRKRLHKSCLKRRVRRIITYGCSTFKRSSDMLSIKEYEFATVLD